MKNKLSKLLSESISAPFLFIGSGFSRRYINLENWSDLLKTFSESIKDYHYYFSSADGNLPKVAQLMASDYHDFFWDRNDNSEKISEHRKILTNKSSALKLEISEYIADKTDQNIYEQQYEEEIKLLKKTNIDGFITTNWDTILEDLFPDYKVYIGQKELLFSQPQSIGEIYKIHGCVSQPNSLVLTEDDYESYNSKNSYLASKLITLFVEHPIVFIGYSLSDPNIINILESIVFCLDDEQIRKLSRNLVFINWIESGEESISESIVSLKKFPLPITFVQLNSFIPLFEALGATKHKIPARILRYCKEQLYEIVRSNSPSEKIKVIDLEDVEDQQNIEFVVGIGIQDKLSSRGYEAIKSIEIIQDIIFNDKNFEQQKLLNTTIPNLLKRTKYIPIYKYLSGTNADSYRTKLSKALDLTKEDFRIKSYEQTFKNKFSGMQFKDFLNNVKPEKAIMYIPFYEKSNIDADLLLEYLKSQFNYFENEAANYLSYYKKAVCYYDFITNR